MIIVARPLSVVLCLAPFRKMTVKAKTYVSWVGLRGAVPIIFATYPLVAGLENSGLLFNTVFFITIVSMLVQGTTVGYMARFLGLSADMEQDSFNIDMPDEIKAALTEMEVGPDFLRHGNTLRERTLQPNTLVMMIRRDDNYIVPTGDTVIEVGDRILVISTDAASLPDDYAAVSRRRRIKDRVSKLMPSRRGRHKSPAMHDDGESEIDLEVLCEMDIMDEDSDNGDAEGQVN
jgi:cell volume regulation protein A